MIQIRVFFNQKIKDSNTNILLCYNPIEITTFQRKDTLNLTYKIQETELANTKSAYKRIEIGERNRLRNKAYKSTVKTLIKKTLISISSLNTANLTSVKELMSLSYSKIDKAVQKGVIHSNNGNSKKSSLAKAFKKHEANLKQYL